MFADTVDVPAEFALNMGQSSRAAGALETGAAQAGDCTGRPGRFSAERGAIENVP
jgi:hypothetical protein